MLSIVLETIKKYNMINEGDSVICALSGGADSVCLLHILNSIKGDLKFNLYAAHLNHMLRGKEAEEDTRFVKSLCDSLNIPLTIKYADIKKEAKDKNISQEMAGRIARYSFFEELSKNFESPKIAVAHNKNDNAETVLLNLIRGTGIAGLCGIPYVRGNIIRPLINTTRDEILNYLKEKSLTYRFDSSNNSLDYQRNRVRNVIIPEINKINPNFIESIINCAESLKADRDFIQSFVDEFPIQKRGEKISFKTSAFLAFHESVQNKIIIKALNMLNIEGITQKTITDCIDIIKNRTGRKRDLPGGFIAEKSYDDFLIHKESKKPAEDETYPIILGKEQQIGDFIIQSSILEEKEFLNCYKSLKSKKNTIILDLDKTPKNITLRRRKNGDFFYPLGLGGKKKLKDFFIDEKIPRDLRDLPCVLEGDRKILAVLPYRADARFAADCQTKKAVIFQFKKI